MKNSRDYNNNTQELKYLEEKEYKIKRYFRNEKNDEI